jgi:DNA recombination protein RmuC
VKKQGNWGEVILERILETSGLEKGREYTTQESFEREGGGRYQPDVVIYLPENKHVVVDAKVSLVAYDNYVSADIKEDQDAFMKDHLRSIRAHIKELADKQYFKLEGLNSPEYVLMFIPIEASFSITVKEDHAIFNEAWSNKIVIVSPSTLIATLMTISSIWNQENQTKNAIEIARQSGNLYDKFEGLLKDLIQIGKRIEDTQACYKSSMNKLSEGKGNLISRVEKLRTLGAKASKEIPQPLIEQAQEGSELAE